MTFSSGNPAVDRYIADGYDTVRGMSSRFAATICGHIIRRQTELGIAGHFAEVGLLTGVHPDNMRFNDIRNGISLDQEVAAHLGGQTRFASLVLGGGDVAWNRRGVRIPAQQRCTLVFKQLFIRGTPDDKDNVAIVQATIALARQFRLRVTAEGVETASQKAFLRAHQCDAIQGFLISAPLPGQDLTEMLGLATA